MSRKVRISLAHKCQLLFGAAVILILAAALSVVWFGMQVMVREGQEETAEKVTAAVMAGIIQPEMPWWTDGPQRRWNDQDVQVSLIEREEFPAAQANEPFLREAMERLELGDRAYAKQVTDERGRPYFYYARAIRKSDLSRYLGGTAAGFQPTVELPAVTNPLVSVLLIQLDAAGTQRQLWLNRIYILAAGLLAGLLAITTFWFITTRLILSPVRVLRDTAEKVGEGDLNIRAEVNTGDEFEQLAGTFNQMLETLKKNEDRLRGINKSLDLKLGELAETNVALFEANKIKGEFLANVSHELRTPLNSIIGFAEVLDETLKGVTGTAPQDEKRRRYINNIISSSRRLLDLINDLLDLAKIEAGRMDVRVGPMSVEDTAEGLINLIRPQAEKRQIELRMKVEPNIPLVQTDAGKFQQVIFNFLSNAVKFTPPGGTVTLSAGVIGPDGKPLPSGAAAASDGGLAGARLRMSVTDTGPGIPLDQHERIFEKFTQLDSTVTKEHGGTGLGLTISRELAEMLRGEIDLDSDTGRGATFSLTIPMVLESRSMPLMPDLAGATHATLPGAGAGAGAARAG